MQVLSLKGIRSALDIDDFAAIAALRQLEELVLDCDQPPELGGMDEIKWGLPEFPEGVLHLVNITHLTLSCHYGITELPAGITSLNKLEVRPLAPVPCMACSIAAHDFDPRWKVNTLGDVEYALVVATAHVQCLCL